MFNTDDKLVLEMCNFLETENEKLENLLTACQGEIQNIRFDSAACKIIPHYRLALARSYMSLNLQLLDLISG